MEALEQYGLAGVIIYLLIKDIIPKIIDLIKQRIPAEIRKQELTEETLRYKLQLEDDNDDREADLREREVTAMEGINKNLILIEHRLTTADTNHVKMLEALAKTNEALGIILDRTRGDTQPIKTLER